MDKTEIRCLLENLVIQVRIPRELDSEKGFDILWRLFAQHPEEIASTLSRKRVLLRMLG